MKVAVLGAAGGIGQALALLLKTQLPSGSDLTLYDIAPVTPGVAKDLSHIPTDVRITGFAGEDPTPALEGADIVLISAGVARKPAWIVLICLMLTRGSSAIWWKNCQNLSESINRHYHQPGEHHSGDRGRSAEKAGVYDKIACSA